MRNWFGRIKLSRQLALVSCLFILIPTLLLGFTILRGQQDSLIQAQLREAQSRRAAWTWSLNLDAAPRSLQSFPIIKQLEKIKVLFKCYGVHAVTSC